MTHRRLVGGLDGELCELANVRITTLLVRLLQDLDQSRKGLEVTLATLQLLDLDRQGEIDVREDLPETLSLPLQVRRMDGADNEASRLLVQGLIHGRQSFGLEIGGAARERQLGQGRLALRGRRSGNRLPEQVCDARHLERLAAVAHPLRRRPDRQASCSGEEWGVQPNHDRSSIVL